MAGPVFISHSSRDLKVARGICDAIESRGVACWISGRDVDPGENFGDAIVEAIERAPAMVLVFSSNANNSEEIKKELALASQHRVAVIPVRVEDITPSQSFRYELATRQWIDMFVDWDQALKRLTDKIVAIEALGKPDGEPSPPKPPPPSPGPSREPTPPRSGRVGILAGVGAACVAALAAGVFLWARPGGTTDIPTVPPHAVAKAADPVAQAGGPLPQVVATAPAQPRSVAEADPQPPAKASPAPSVPNAAPAPLPPATPVVAVAPLPADKGAASADPGAATAKPELAQPTPAVAPAAPARAEPQAKQAEPASDQQAASKPAAAVAPAAPAQAEPPVKQADQQAAPKSAPTGVAAAPAQIEPPAKRSDPAADQQPASTTPAAALAPPAVASPPPVVVAALSPTVPTAAAPDGNAHAAAIKSFKDCDDCPEMVVVPSGAALIGSPSHEAARLPTELPQSEATIPAAFAVGRYDVTFDEWDACVAEGGCGSWRPGDYTWGRGRQPVILVSWKDAKSYVAWLSQKTGKSYRLLSETEWEYAARGCATTACPNQPFWFGAITPEIANYDSRYAYLGSPKGLGRRRAVPVDEGPPNPFGLTNMLGNVRQWVEDCWNPNPGPPPPDGAPRLDGDCAERVTRGGSYDDKPQDLRAAARARETIETRSQKIGFRIARALDP